MHIIKPLLCGFKVSDLVKAMLDSEWFISDTLGLNSSVDLGLNLDLKVMNLIAMRLLL